MAESEIFLYDVCRTENRNRHSETTRGEWTSRREYILSLLGFSVGLGSLWRFPYLCNRNGGGAFLIPYFMGIITCSVPLFFLEITISQFSSRSAAPVWVLCPLFKGNKSKHITIKYGTLRVSSGIDKFGSVQVHLLLCNLASWVVAFLCLMKGIRSVGKVVYVTALLPYMLLTVLLIRSCMMPGAGDGIVYFFRTDFSRLASVQVWLEALLQGFYSTGVTYGGLITMSSYNNFNNRPLK
ncbi:sodium- and chloride-dependent glycine transporter 1-like [Haliotis rufescens]|uniref:sodium- and chloride-dependent glycine transporter 1-like n=1 Tax=Haliotis rufescens TaxID=6454 RepID=UPI00201F8B4D|nr:sodium- and chloride-dependent glycine transporter 1-like [Haliotis rufescens]